MPLVIHYKDVIWALSQGWKKSNGCTGSSFHYPTRFDGGLSLSLSLSPNPSLSHSPSLRSSLSLIPPLSLTLRPSLASFVTPSNTVSSKPTPKSTSTTPTPEPYLRLTSALPLSYLCLTSALPCLTSLCVTLFHDSL